MKKKRVVESIGRVNIFKFNGEKFDEILDEIFDNIDKEALLKNLIESGLS